MSDGYKYLGVSRIISFLVSDPRLLYAPEMHVTNGSLHSGVVHGPVHQYDRICKRDELFGDIMIYPDVRDFYRDMYFNTFYSTTEDFRIKDSLFGSNDKYAMVSPEKTWLDSKVDYTWGKPDDVILSTEWKSRGLTDTSKYSIDEKGNVVDIQENVFYTTSFLTSDYDFGPYSFENYISTSNRGSTRMKTAILPKKKCKIYAIKAPSDNTVWTLAFFNSRTLVSMIVFRGTNIYYDRYESDKLKYEPYDIKNLGIPNCGFQRYLHCTNDADVKSEFKGHVEDEDTRKATRYRRYSSGGYLVGPDFSYPYTYIGNYAINDDPCARTVGNSSPEWFLNRSNPGEEFDIPYAAHDSSYYDDVGYLMIERKGYEKITHIFTVEGNNVIYDPTQYNDEKLECIFILPPECEIVIETID
jgi:hypothetical protein